MTSKQIFEYALVELNKKEAPSLLLEDYNYFINKTINHWTNEMYNLYEINQQKTDDLRVLKSTAILNPILNNDNYNTSDLFNKIYEVDLPDDYLHILNCIVEYQVLKNYKCYDANTYWQQGAKRLESNKASQVINNYYLRPSYKNPYFYINNVNISNIYPTSDNQVDIDYTPIGTEPEAENIQKIALKRYGNKSKVRMEIRYGKDNTVFKLSKVYIDYLKAPQFIRLTQEQVDEVEDNSQLLEFPDYVCQEIVNKLVKLLLENSSDPRIQSHPIINQSIATPGQEQQR